MTVTFSTSPDPLNLLDLITVLFVWLRLTDQIDWHWGWVLSPILAETLFKFLIMGFLLSHPSWRPA